MNLTTLAALLQTTTILLTGIQHNSQISQPVAEQAVVMASHIVQIGAQVEASPKIHLSVPANNSIWPNITDLYNSAYLDAEGNYNPLNSDVGLVGEDTSFGDLNADGLDDAAVIVETLDNSGGPMFALGAMLNQSGVMFNVTDMPLGHSVQIYSHQINQGNIVLDMQINNGPRATYTYQLLGDQLTKQ